MPDREALREIKRLLASPVRCPECREPVGWDPPAEHDAECFIGAALARVRALLAEPEPSQIRGRWTREQEVNLWMRIDQYTASTADTDELVARLVQEVVPVPDEQAIERAAKAVYDLREAREQHPRSWSEETEYVREPFREQARAVLAAALESE